MDSKIKQIVDQRGTNPHQLSQACGITYRRVLDLVKYGAKPTTPILTLQRVADALDVTVTDLYDVESLYEVA